MLRQPLACVRGFCRIVCASLLFVLTPPAMSEPEAAAELAVQAVPPVFIEPILLDRNDRMTIPVTLDGHGPYGFVVDTGAERTVISSELASLLELAPAGRARVVGIADAVTAEMFHAPRLALRDMMLGDSVVPAFSQRHIGGPGMIGIDSLARHRLVIDFVAGRMDIRESPRSRRPARDPEFDHDVIVVTARRREGRLILSNASLAGSRVDIIVDTGAQTSIGNPALHRLVLRSANREGGQADGRLTSVTGATLPVSVGQIARITIGGVDITSLPVAYADSPVFAVLGLENRPALLLGMDALRLFDRVSIDFANRRVIFDMPDQAGSPPRFRYAGA